MIKNNNGYHLFELLMSRAHDVVPCKRFEYKESNLPFCMTVRQIIDSDLPNPFAPGTEADEYWWEIHNMLHVNDAYEAAFKLCLALPENPFETEEVEPEAEAYELISEVVEAAEEHREQEEKETAFELLGEVAELEEYDADTIAAEEPLDIEVDNHADDGVEDALAEDKSFKSKVTAFFGKFLR